MYNNIPLTFLEIDAIHESCVSYVIVILYNDDINTSDTRSLLYAIRPPGVNVSTLSFNANEVWGVTAGDDDDGNNDSDAVMVIFAGSIYTTSTINTMI